MTRYRQAIIAAFAVATILNAFIALGALGGYQYYFNVLPLTGAEAVNVAWWIQGAIVVVAGLAWWRS